MTEENSQTTPAGGPTVIESRLHLFSALAEAAETEHNLMCLYIFSALSLKRSVEEDITAEESVAIESWRRTIIGISLEEMTHLCLVSNLFSALGGTCHFSRPDFPVSPWLYPAEFVMELAPFNLDTIEHFIFLERPENSAAKDAEAFRPRNHFERLAPRNRIMPTSGDYKTVGTLYRAIREALVHLSNELSEDAVFCGDPSRQVTFAEVPLKGLNSIHNLASALNAIETIVSQDEGATLERDSHYERFTKIKEEYLHLLRKNPNFRPSRAVVRNPVMRKPAEPENQVWITHPVAARFLDLANAIYTFTLRVLTQVYVVEERDPAEKREFLSMSLTLMHVMAALGETLTLLPVSEQSQDQFSGITFAMVRTLQPLGEKSEIDLLMQAIEGFGSKLTVLRSDLASLEISSGAAKVCAECLEEVRGEIEKVLHKLSSLRESRDSRSKHKKVVTVPVECP
jgi:hypothetical protein